MIHRRQRSKIFSALRVLCGSLTSTSGKTNKTIANFSIHPLILLSGFHLSGHVIELLQTTDEFDCGFRCLRNQHCRSYNSKDTGGNIHGKTICQLNNQTRLTAPDFFKPTHGFTYFEKGNALRKADADLNILS